MELYAQLLNYIIPVFLLLILVEKLIERYQGKSLSRSLDSVTSISSGMTNVIKDTLGLTISVFTYEWLLGHLALFDIGTTWTTFLITFIIVDFKGYWTHRWEHKINIFWNRHVIHHSSEEFNLACGLRQSISTVFDYFTFLFLPAAILGVPVEVIAVVVPIHLFLQFWYHTRLIGKLGILEKIIVTPSHHRVHHAINREYLDKNLGQIFIFWDKLFGTYQEELPHVPCVYGITRPAGTWNPIKINFQHFSLLVRDAYYTQRWKDKWRIWWMPTGWRPPDMSKRFPVYGISDMAQVPKYDVNASKGLKIWSWTQLFFNYGLLIYLFAFFVQIGWTSALFYGGLVLLSVYAFTELMDGNPNALVFEMSKSMLALGYIYIFGDWFLSNKLLGSWFTVFVIFYQLTSVIMVAYFSSDKIKVSPKAQFAR
ncbi:MAG: sterol desaturase family protein [Cyclobacteriaceae bacterium]